MRSVDALKLIITDVEEAGFLTDAELVTVATELATSGALFPVPSAVLAELANRFHSLKSGPWFSFDGCDFERHETEAAAKADAEKAMELWETDAESETGWDECADQVCFGLITHAVRVETREPTDEERELYECDYVAAHFLEPVEHIRREEAAS